MKFIYLWVFLFLGGTAFPQEKGTSFLKAADKNLAQLYKIKTITKEKIEYSQNESSDNSQPIVANGIYRLKNSDETIGFLVLTYSMGRFDQFDYMIVYNPDISVKKIKILNYTSSHGGEVASPGWLRQFEGYDGKPLRYGSDIDALAGATISAGSLTRDVEAITNFMKKKIQN